MTRRLVTVTCGLLLLAGLVGAGIGAADVGLLGAQTKAGDFDTTVFRIEVFANQSAQWTIEHSQSLENDSAVRGFEQFAETFNTQETDLFRNFRLRARNLVSFGENVTNRPMNATAFRRSAFTTELGQTRGVVEMSFVWTSFARQEATTVVVDDVFQGGMYIADGQRLEFLPGPTLAFDEVAPDPDSMAARGDLQGSDSVTWFGEVRFADQRPYVSFQPRSSVSTQGTNGGSGTATITSAQLTPTDTPPGPTDTRGDEGITLFVVGVVVLVAAAAGVAWYSRYMPSGRSQPVDPGPDAGAASVEPAGAEGVSESELVSDEDRVVGLLEANGGRMKQVDIVDETEWSKSKVSMLLSEMEDEGHISKLRVGRENIISLSGREPDAAGSPFEDE